MTPTPTDHQEESWVDEWNKTEGERVEKKLGAIHQYIEYIEDIEYIEYTPVSRVYRVYRENGGILSGQSYKTY